MRLSPTHTPTEGGGSALVMGAGIAGIEFLTAFPYFAAIAMIVGASVGGASKVALLVLYNLVYVLPLIVIVVLCAVMGERAGQVLTPVGDWGLAALAGGRRAARRGRRGRARRLRDRASRLAERSPAGVKLP